MLRFLGNTFAAAMGRLQYGQRGISSIASSPMSSRVKHAWEKQDKLALGLAFVGGWICVSLINIYRRREDYYRIHRFINDEQKHLEETHSLIQKELKKLKELDV